MRLMLPICDLGFPGGASVKEPVCQCRRHKRCGFDPWVQKIPWKKMWQPTLVFLSGEYCEQRSLAGYGPQSHKEWDTTEASDLARRCACVIYHSSLPRFGWSRFHRYLLLHPGSRIGKPTFWIYLEFFTKCISIFQRFYPIESSYVFSSTTLVQPLV